MSYDIDGVVRSRRAALLDGQDLGQSGVALQR